MAPPLSAARNSHVQESAVQQPRAVQQLSQQPVRERTSASWELLALAENFQSRPSVASLTDATLLTAAPVEPGLSQQLAPLDHLPVSPAHPARSKPVTVSVAPIPVRLSSTAVLPAATPVRARSGFLLEDPVPAGKVGFRAARGGESRLIEQPAEPLPSARRSVAFIRDQMPGSAHGGMPVADLAPVSDLRLKPLVLSQNGSPKDHGDAVSAPPAYAARVPVFAPVRLKLAGASLAELQSALKTSVEEHDRAAIQAVEASFYEKPAVCLLPAPAEIVTAPAPPARQWLRAQKPKLTPVAPQNAGLAALAAGPRTPTLAGPSLPHQLLNLDLRNSSLRRKRSPSWPISLLLAIVLILGVVAVLQYVTQDRDTTAASTAASTAAPVPATKAAPAPLRVAQEHPSARSVEVAGVRIVTGPNKRPQLEYVAINHSASEITGLSIRIAVRSVEALEDAPLFSVSNAIPSLGPNQSKEIRTELDPSIQPSSIPDWHSLRTEVLIARQ